MRGIKRFADRCGNGFRALASTRLNELGWAPDVIERQLAHVERNSVRAAYNYASYLAERRKMMLAWADHLDSQKSFSEPHSMIGMLWLLRLVDRKKSPSRIPLSGLRVDQRDYFSLEVVEPSLSQPILFSRMRGSLASFREWDPSQQAYCRRRAVDPNTLTKARPYVRYYYRRFEFAFDRPWKLWIFLALSMHRIRYILDAVAQKIYNRRSLAVIERTELMNYIADRYMADSNFVPHDFARIRDRYGSRIVFHPHFNSMLRRERLLLDSLVKTGELNKHNGNYGVDPALFCTLDRIAIEERRHRQGIVVQRLVVAIALATLIAACVQAWAAYEALHISHRSPSPEVHNV